MAGRVDSAYAVVMDAAGTPASELGLKRELLRIVPPPQGRSLQFLGSGDSAFTLFFKGFLLTVATLGLYWPWAMTERRRYFWGNTELEGSRFRFNGQGGDLFKGVILVSIAYGLVGMLVAQLARWVSPLAGVLALAGLGLVYALYVAPRLMLGSAKYRASKSEWRGIRFHLNAKFSEFYPIYLKGLVLTVATCGLYAPVFIEDLFRFGIERLSLGNRAFRYEGDRLGYALTWYAHFFFLTSVTFGLYGPWARAAMFRFRVSRVRFGEARLKSQIDGLSYGWFTVRAILAPFTLFMLTPRNAVFRARRMIETLSIEGDLNASSILQVQGSAGSMDEAGTLLFGYDLGLDFG